MRLAVTVTNGMTANHYSLHLRTMWSSVPETVPIGVATPASKHIGVVGASFRGLFPLLMMSASGTKPDHQRCPQFGRYRGDSGHGGYERRLPSLTHCRQQASAWRRRAARGQGDRRSHPMGKNQAVKEAPEQIVAQLNGARHRPSDWPGQ